MTFAPGDKTRLTHGHSIGKRSPTHTSWHSMLSRCNNPRLSQYKNYGGRGIKVCKRWEKFENFLADMGERPPGTSLDRKNNNGNYCKSNCRWATRAEQSRNSSRTLNLTFKGETKCLSDWAAKFGVTKSSMQHAYNKHGWPASAELMAMENPNASD